MKVYSISRWAFYGICLLIIVLPVSRYWELILRGRTAEGVILKYERFLKKSRIGEDRMENASTIVFSCEGITYTTRGPLNYELRQGRSVKVRYDPEDPAHNCILTFSGFYLNDYSILPLFLMIVWGAFYLSFNNYHKRKRAGNNAGLASSPYRPFRKSSESKEKPSRLQENTRRISPKDS